MRSRVALGLILCLSSLGKAEDRTGRHEARSYPAATVRVSRKAPARFVWTSRKTANFSIRGDRAEIDRAVDVCEELRRDLFKTWLGQTSPRTWEPRCEIVLHPSEASYLAFVGREGRNSSGCCTVKSDNGRIISRRIDVRADRPDPLTTALPHELTHVVLSEAFLGHDLPRWADEGIAVMADPERKQLGRLEDVEQALADRSLFRVADLLRLDDYPGQSKLDIFYGQSASLVQFLVSRKTPAHLIEFVRQAGKQGYDTALREHYEIDGVAELEQLWINSAKSAGVALQPGRFLRFTSALVAPTQLGGVN